MIYLDNAATTPLLEEVKPFLIKNYFNPSSQHSYGDKSNAQLKIARSSIASTLHCQASDIIFTSGGTESNNLAINGIAKKMKSGKIITTEIEHPSVLNTCKHLERKGFKVVYLPVDSNGRINIEQLKSHLTFDTILVSIMAVNNEIGTLQDLQSIGELCRSKRIPFHTDAVQAYGHMNIDVRKMRISMLSGSGHKFGAPKGVGFLYVHKGVHLKPLVYGGGQEKKLRSGTQNVNSIIAMGKAALMQRKLMRENTETRKVYYDYLVSELKSIDGVQINGDREHNIHSHINISIDGVKGENMASFLDSMGICVSTGSACSSKDNKPSHVLKAIGLSDDEANSSIRISFNEQNTLEELKEFIAQLKLGINLSRAIKK